MPRSRHPSEVLFDGDRAPVSLPVCDHYAGSEKLLSKSMSLQAELGPVFDITADCEDGAQIGREAEHAEMVVSLINSGSNRFNRIGVRIHDVSHSSWHTDLELIIRGCGRRLAFITIPKLAAIRDLNRIVAAIDDVALQSGVRREIPVQVLIENHQGLANVHDIAAHPRVECLSFGLMDYVSGFRGALPSTAMSSPGQFENTIVQRAKAEISVAAHSFGKTPAHGVCTDIANPQAAGDDASRALHELGFTRMWSIHPIQIQPIVAALTPGTEEINQASDILLAASAASWGPIRHDGRLHDRASYRYYWSILGRANTAGARLPQDAKTAFFSDAR